MLITSYGIDCALSQIIYYYHINSICFTTISNKMINKYLSKNKPKYLIGLRPDIDCVDESTIIIDNTKRSYNMYNDVFKNFIYDTKISKTSLFAKHIKVNSNIITLARLADSIVSGNYSEMNVLLMDFYNAVGHDNFVYRFLINTSITLNKNEQQLALRYRKFQNDLADSYIHDFVYMRDNIIVCKTPYSIKNAVENTIIEKYGDDLILIVTWDYDTDGHIRINLCSKSDLAGKIAEKNNGDNYIRSGYYKLCLKEDEDNLNDYIMEQIMDSYRNIVEEEHNKKYLEKQKQLQELL